MSPGNTAVLAETQWPDGKGPVDDAEHGAGQEDLAGNEVSENIRRDGIGLG